MSKRTYWAELTLSVVRFIGFIFASIFCLRFRDTSAGDPSLEIETTLFAALIVCVLVFAVGLGMVRHRMALSSNDEIGAIKKRHKSMDIALSPLLVAFTFVFHPQLGFSSVVVLVSCIGLSAFVRSEVVEPRTLFAMRFLGSVVVLVFVGSLGLYLVINNELTLGAMALSILIGFWVCFFAIFADGGSKERQVAD